MNTPKPMEPFVAAAVQDAPVFLDLRLSVQKACDLIAQAARTGAKLIVFPETWLPGYPVWLDESPNVALWDHPPAKALFAELFENSIALPGPELEQLAKAAMSAGSTVVMGAHERCGGTLYNTLFYISHTGQLAGIHRKIMPTYTERLIWGQGDGSTLTVIDTPQGRVGGLICWEHWMPLLRAAMHQQNELVHIAQWPTVKEMNQVAVRQYAFEGQCFVIAAGSLLSKKQLCTNEPTAGSGTCTNEPNSTRTCTSTHMGLNPPTTGKKVLIPFIPFIPANYSSSEQPNPLLTEIPGDPNRLLLRGGSAIIAPDGTYLGGPLFDEPGILTAEIRPSLATEGRLLLDTSGHYSRPDIFQLAVNTQPQQNVAFHSGSSK